MAEWRRHALTVGDGTSCHKVDYVSQVKDILNLKGHHWFKSYSHLTEWVDFAYWWSCIGKGLRAACEAGLFPMLSTWRACSNAFILCTYYDFLLKKHYFPTSTFQIHNNFEIALSVWPIMPLPPGCLCFYPWLSLFCPWLPLCCPLLALFSPCIKCSSKWI